MGNLGAGETDDHIQPVRWNRGRVWDILNFEVVPTDGVKGKPRA